MVHIQMEVVVGTTHFRVPDLRGKVIAICLDNMGGGSADNINAITNATNADNLGGVLGVEEYTLSVINLDCHYINTSVTSTLSATATSTARIGNDSGSQTSLAFHGNYNQGLNTTAVTTTVSGTASGSVQ